MPKAKEAVEAVKKTTVKAAVRPAARAQAKATTPLEEGKKAAPKAAPKAARAAAQARPKPAAKPAIKAAPKAAPRRRTAAPKNGTDAPSAPPVPEIPAVEPASAAPEVPPSQEVLYEAQASVVASKFVHAEPKKPRGRATRRSLPATYGESHLLLLVRDPQTLFAAWDMAAPAVEALKLSIGPRAFAVSTLTLRLMDARGVASMVHVEKKARSQYVKVDGASPYIADIGFTTPTGRFEFVARSAPCHVPVGANPRLDWAGTGRATMRPTVLGYREAGALARQGLLSAPSRPSAAAAALATAPGPLPVGAFAPSLPAPPPCE